MEDFAVIIAGLFQGLKSYIRWVIILVLMIVLIVGFWEYERLSGHFYLDRLEAKVTMLKDLQTISAQGFDDRPELYQAYMSAINELNDFEVLVPLIPPITISSPREASIIGKAISGASVWIVILIAGISMELPKARKSISRLVTIIIGVLLLIGLFSWIGTLIPTLFNPWVNYLGFPILQIYILWLISRKGKKPVT